MQSTASNDVAFVSQPGRRKQHIKGATGGNKGATGRAQTKDDGMARRHLQKNNRGIPHNCNKSCNNCGRFHAKRNCPAYGKTCDACKKPNHFGAQCKSVNYVCDSECTSTCED
ncbi:hypothetical protein DPMN_023332 [Dreissena polymorpha]|uniref:CCHC-type domain-containing protein n=1 Tax=Dreissena polymorpha TaxID=45954 RepID=A0A9D4LMP8_DREPO|nr:hypothetical protein DPMN_023332 [Dreissena polymorpha]